MKSGMIASELAFNNLDSNNKKLDIPNFYNEFLRSWAGQELKKARNVRPSFKFGQKIGMIISGIDQLILRGKAPWTIKAKRITYL